MATEYHGHVEPPDPVKRAAARRGEGTRNREKGESLLTSEAPIAVTGVHREIAC